MYSGTTLTKYSGVVLGTHQKIDRIARRHLSMILPQRDIFPPIKQILHFEGKNGPDGIKRKSPMRDEPWHFYSPFDNNDSKIIQLINSHYENLVVNLRQEETNRAAFEAAWLAHALVDGLTPAHHYPYEDRLVELRGGESINTRTSIRLKAIMPGKTRYDKIKNNWKMWGARGLLTTHWWFEFGTATLIAPMSFDEAIPTEADVNEIRQIGVMEWFKKAAREIASLNLYEEYYKKGWTASLARQIRTEMTPLIIKTVTLSWYMSVVSETNTPPHS